MIVVLGAGGMLGRAVVEACERRGLRYIGLTHQQFDVTDPSSFNWADEGDVVINCAGILPGGNDVDMLRVNALAPHYLAALSSQRRFHLIHVSTDCVFSGGIDGAEMHKIVDTPNPDTHYSRCKWAGEPWGYPFVTVVRTSFVGPTHGLWKWLADQPPSAMVEGWTEAWWSGSTVWAVADGLLTMAKGMFPNSFQPLVHLATAHPITKLDVLRQLRRHIDRPDIVIEPRTVYMDRSLRANTRFLPSLHDALQDVPSNE